jgi:hypothetical protein
MASFDTSLEDISLPDLDQENVQFHSEEELILSHKDLTDVMQKSEYKFTDHNEQKQVLFDFIISKLCIDDKKVEIIKNDLLEKINFFLLKAIEKYIKSSRKYERFVINNEMFLSKNFEVPKLSQSFKTESQPHKSKIYNIVRV